METEESPPAVPPKDPRYQPSMDGRSSQPASGSKRKRESHDEAAYNLRDGRLDVGELEFTPTKRARSNAGIGDDDSSNDDTPVQRSVRRKKGLNNLSRLNLRHAASMSTMPHRQASPSRESKFQEGSLNDKPSEKPPSVYTRFTRTDSGNLEHVDQLMTDYHEDMPTPSDSYKAALEYEKATIPQRVADISAQQKKEEGAMFRFGRSLAAAFHPISLWNRIWNEQKEEMAREHQRAVEAQRNAQHKAEVEAQYARMKSSGQFNLQPVSLHTPHDSAIALPTASSGPERERSTSFGSMLRQSQEDAGIRETSEAPDSTTKPLLRGMRSRLHLRKPSLQNLKNGLTGGLKRVASDMNLANAADRESSSSVSPVKPEFGSALRLSHSKQDLKRQRRLSKRVSDLESKLDKARSELDEALVAASPLPRLGNKYERFTPVSTVRRPKFIPGALATLPSEGVLFPEAAGSNGTGQMPPRNLFPRTRKALDLSKAFDDIDDEEEDDEETVKASRARAYPANAKTIFSSPSQAEENEPRESAQKLANETNSIENLTSELTGSTEAQNIDNNSQVGIPAEIPRSPQQPTSEEAVVSPNDDSKIVKKTKKPAKSRKRGFMRDDEKSFRPGAEDDDDAEWDEAAEKPKKKRKSTGKVDPDQQEKTMKPKSPAGKLTKKARKDDRSPKQAKTAQEQTVIVVEKSELGVDNDPQSEDELIKGSSARGSMISNPESLEPVYEEEEETTITTTVPVKDVPSKPTAKATPARFGRNAVRSRSNSPHKREGVQVIVEDKIMTRAGEAAQNRRGSRSSSPGAQDPSTITVVPGEDGVPVLPEATKGSPKKEKKSKVGGDFEWPDDVF